MIFVGSMRCYFNRHGAAPLMWCVEPSPTNNGAWPKWEIAVRDVVFDGVQVRTVYKAKATADEDDGRPSGWLEASGRLFVGDDGIARITHRDAEAIAGDVR